MVFLKLAAVFFVILVGAFYINPANWSPFAPYGMYRPELLRTSLDGQVNAGGQPVGMLAGAAIIFFAYIGFDSVSTHAEEAKNPTRDVPIGIIASLLICTILYIAVVAVLTGMVPLRQPERGRGRFGRLQAGRPAVGRVHHRRCRRGRHHIRAARADAVGAACVPRDGTRRHGAAGLSSAMCTRGSGHRGSPRF